jgi:Zn-dependent protease
VEKVSPFRPAIQLSHRQADRAAARFDKEGVGLYSPCAVDPAKVVDVAIYLAALLFAVSFHESAHAWMAWRWGDSTAKDLGRISMNPIRHIDLFGSILLPLLLYFTSGLIFGWAKPTPVRLENTRDPRRADRWISGAGPVSNLILAAAGLLLLALLQAVFPQALDSVRGAGRGSGVVAPLILILLSFAYINFFLAIFNLLPIPPLDGGWVLASFFVSMRRGMEAIAPFGFLILILLSGTGILRRIMLPMQRLFDAVVGMILT